MHNIIMFAMKLLIVVLTAFLTKGEGQNTVALFTIPANQSSGSCPAEDLLEKARQNISTTVQRKLTGMILTFCCSALASNVLHLLLSL